MILSHFTPHPFVLDRDRVYRRLDRGLSFKPSGLWLSDESAYGWKEWCRDQDFRMETCEFETRFKIKTKEILVLNTDKAILSFHEKYFRKKKSAARFSAGDIDWSAVADAHKGILITPYSWELRCHPEMMWYYTWDCASACIWDLSALSPFLTP